MLLKDHIPSSAAAPAARSAPRKAAVTRRFMLALLSPADPRGPSLGSGSLSQGLRPAALVGAKSRRPSSTIYILLSGLSVAAPDIILELHDAIGEASGGAKLQPQETAPWSGQRNAGPDENRDDVNGEGVDLAGVKEGGDEARSSHDPDVLAGLAPETPREGRDRPADEGDARRRLLRRCAGEDVVADAGTHAEVLAPELQPDLVGLPPPEDRVDRAQEGAHSVAALGARPVEPGKVAIGPGDVAVGGDGDPHDDAAGFLHVRLFRRPVAPNRTLLPRRFDGRAHGLDDFLGGRPGPVHNPRHEAAFSGSDESAVREHLELPAPTLLELDRLTQTSLDEGSETRCLGCRRG